MSYTHAYSSHCERRMRDYFHSLNEKDRRRYAAIEAQKLPHGGIRYIAEILGCSTKTIQRGLTELEHLGEQTDHARIRRPGAGRPKKSSNSPS